MQQMPWSLKKTKQFETETGLAVMRSESLPFSFSTDFSHLIESMPIAVCAPSSPHDIKKAIEFASHHNLSFALRSKGLSQGGQALAVDGGFILHLEKLSKVLDKEDNSIWVEASATFADLLDKSLQSQEIPFVIPYNCNLSVGGVISAGGLGASSFKFGTVTAHVKALEVVLSTGEIEVIDERSPLFHACLSGQGRFAVITKVCFKLRKAEPLVKTFYLIYLSKEEWLSDLCLMKENADYLEAFCSPAMQGLKLIDNKRRPFAEWLYVIHVSKEYKQKETQLSDISAHLKPWKVLHSQNESLYSYLHRHDSRFDMMKMLGQWDLFHPWYECFIPEAIAVDVLNQWLEQLPLHFASIVQVVSIAKMKQKGFFMMPDGDNVIEIMILNPGILKVLVPSCLEAIAALDKELLEKGGKRYLSGFLGMKLEDGYWQKHFGETYAQWTALKNKYDKNHLFSSYLHP